MSSNRATPVPVRPISAMDFSSTTCEGPEQATLLITSVKAGDVDMVRDLLQQGSSANQVAGEFLACPLMAACYVKNAKSRMAIFKLLLEHNADAEYADISGKDCLMYACSQGLHSELELILETRAYNFNAADKQGNNLLHCCAKAGKLPVLNKVLDVMLRHRMNINIRNKSGQTSLDVATVEKHSECAKRLRVAGGRSMLPKIMPSESILPPLPETRCWSVEWHGKERRLALPPMFNVLRSASSPDLKAKLPPIAEESSPKCGMSSRMSSASSYRCSTSKGRRC